MTTEILLLFILTTLSHDPSSLVWEIQFFLQSPQIVWVHFSPTQAVGVSDKTIQHADDSSICYLSYNQN